MLPDESLMLRTKHATRATRMVRIVLERGQLIRLQEMVGFDLGQDTVP